MKLVSPDSIHNAACGYYLEGRKPRSLEDWNLVVNFWAANAAEDLEAAICRVMAMLYDCPLPPAHIEAIAEFQLKAKRKEQRA